jgi:pyrroline-5-carboxylate reductase
MLSLSTAMVETGAANDIADRIVDVVGDAGPHALLLAIVLLTVVFGQLISNMATALIKGLLAAGLYRPEHIVASDVDVPKLAALRRRFKVGTTTDNAALVRAARVLVIAVKPQIIDAVLAQMRPAATPRKLFVSIAAGVTTARLEAGLGASARVLRVMPNTPALLGKGMSVLARGRHATVADERLGLRLLRAVGAAVAVQDERWLDAVTGLSGSGPAYVYLFAEGLIAGGVAAGLPAALPCASADST